MPVQVQDLDATGSTGLIAVPAAGVTLLLENGGTVGFASTGTAGFRAGDYWVFAARTADASVEILDGAPPRGIHHHYARLGLLDVAAGTVTDCRNSWPPRGGDGSTGDRLALGSAIAGGAIAAALIETLFDKGALTLEESRTVLDRALRNVSLHHQADGAREAVDIIGRLMRGRFSIPREAP
jgi:hypothetical protein